MPEIDITNPPESVSRSLRLIERLINRRALTKWTGKLTLVMDIKDGGVGNIKAVNEEVLK